MRWLRRGEKCALLCAGGDFMDTTGEIIRRLRREKGLTQLALANLLHLSDRTVSKWECGRGLPDPGLLPELARLLGAGAEELLRGDLRENPPQGGNMKNLKCYFCPHCGAVGFSVPEMKHSCCGRILEPLAPQAPDVAHAFHIEVRDGARQVTLDHPMKKEHHLLLLAFVSGGKCLLFRQYPEWEARAEIPLRGHGRLLALCSRDGLFETRL